MLEPREADIPALFLILVVLPLVAYILLGKWSVSAKKRERISLLAQLAAEEGLRSQAMAIPDVIPIVSSPNNGLRACARCFNSATTRCSRCKSVRYCSGKCQIIHWREVHKQECQQLETVSSSSSPETFSVNGSVNEILFFSDSISSQYFGCNIKQNMVEQAPSDYMMYSSARTGFPDTVDSLVTDASQVSMLDRKTEKCASRKLRRKGGIASNTSEGACGSRAMYSTLSGSIPSKEDYVACKSRLIDPSALDELTPEKHDVNISDGYIDGQATSSTTMHETYRYQRQHSNVLESINHCGFPCSSQLTKCGASELENGMSLVHNRGRFLKGESISSDETIEPNSELTALKGGTKAKRAPYSHANKISKLPKSSLKETGETHCSEREKGQVAEERKFLSFGDSAIEASNEVANPRMLKMMGLRKPTKLSRQDPQIISSGRHKIKMLFPYEEFVKFFLCEVLDLSPRGLLNCGNSCYANAVLQCLTYTKPLTIYLLRKTHSRSLGCGKDWCLICELEKHVIMLRENEGPLSPSRILSHLQSINCHIGDGNQEDAHEFLRFLVASMQSICLEGLGEESKVDPRLQETTFIQHTFGGNLRSKVKCLSCHNESERYENILDLTLEIFGWVESLEDALTQFTTPEDLDGENMYRCGRCAAYVRARKQLSIHEAPNILTIVLKRFQEGRYGKINKCITFPDMLDMIPFMTGMGDIPPLYILYAVVVHLDTLNASFSGHYVSYVKDMQGNWFKIDDAEVQPVSLSQVMSEGAYMLFYTRSSPRPQSTLPRRATRHQVLDSTSYCSTSRAQKPYRPVQKKSSSQFVIQEPHLDDTRVDITNGFANHTSNDTLRRENRNVVSTYETYNEPIRLMEFSDATSSDWSLFTSSDEASFTTDSARDSFSTVDYGDTCNIEPISSIFHAMYAPEYSHSSFPSRKFSNSRPHSRFVCQERPSKGDFSQQSSSATEFSSDSNSGMFERYGSNPIHGFDQTYDLCKL